MSYGSLYSGSIASGAYSYYLIITGTGVTFSLAVTSGSVILYASESVQSPSYIGGYDWTIQTSNYTERYASRPGSSRIYIALLGQLSNNSYIIQADANSATTTGMLINYIMTFSD